MISRVVKVLAFVLTLVFIASVSTQAQLTVATNYDGTLTITGFSGPVPTNLVVPTSIDGRIVTCIGDKAFYYARYLETVDLSSTITTIGDRAFTECYGLKRVGLSQNLTSIGQSAFELCLLLDQIVVPDSVTNLGSYSFAACYSLSNVVIGSGISSVKEGTFQNCLNLTNVSIPEGVTNLEAWSFYGCSSLARIVFPQSLEHIGVASFMSCTNLHEVSYGESLLEIADGAFLGAVNLGDVYIPSSVTKLGGAPFTGCYKMTNINVAAANPAYMSSGGVLFDKTQNHLLEIPAGIHGGYSIPAGVVSIAGRAASDVSLSSLNIPASVTNIDDIALAWSLSLLEINVATQNEKFASIDGVLFDKMGQSLIQYPLARAGSYTVPAGTKTIGMWAFSDGILNDITLPIGLTNIDSAAFFSCTNLTSIDIPGSVKQIPGYAFFYCTNLSHVSLASGVASLAWSAFSDCAMTNVVIPATVTNIEADAFATTVPLSIFFAGNAPTGSTNLFRTASVYCLSGTAGWSNTFAGAPVSLWNPLLRCTSNGTSNAFQIIVEGTPDIPICVDFCNEFGMNAWQRLQTCTLTNGQISIFDSGANVNALRFYRVRSP